MLFRSETPESVKTSTDSFKIDGEVDPNTLSMLKPVMSQVISSAVGDIRQVVDLSFRKVISENEIDTYLTINGNKDAVGPISFIKLCDNELHVCTGQGDEKEWHYFELKSLPDEWSSVFGKTKSMLRVINWC